MIKQIDYKPSLKCVAIRKKIRLVDRLKAHKLDRLQTDLTKLDWKLNCEVIYKFDYKTAIANSIEYSNAKSIEHSIAKPIEYSIAKPIECSIARSIAISTVNPIAKSITD